MRSLLTIPSGEECPFELVEKFCQLGIRESRWVEYKRDFPANNVNLAKTISAFANTLGGTILIGVEADDSNRPRVPPKGITLAVGIEEKILQICSLSIFPPIWPDIWVVPIDTQGVSSEKGCIVVIRIQSSQAVPHSIADRKEIYLRTGSISQPFESLATIDQIQELLRRRKDGIENRRSLTSRFCARSEFFYDLYLQEMLPNIRGGLHKPTVLDVMRKLARIEFTCVPCFPAEPLTSSRDLRQVVETIPLFRPTVGSPISPLNHGSIRTVQESLVQYSGRNYFQFGQFDQYGLVAYRENSVADARAWRDWLYGQEDSSFLRAIHPVSFRGLVLGTILFLPRFYAALGYWGPIEFRIGIANARGYAMLDSYGDTSPVCPDDEVSWRASLSVGELRESVEEHYTNIVQHIYAAFGWDKDIAGDLRKEFQVSSQNASQYY